MVLVKLAPLVIALLLSLAACDATIVPISGTPTAELVLANARRVAHELDSYRSTVTVVETTRYPQSPALNSSTSQVHIVEVGSSSEFRMDLSWGLELVHTDGNIYSRMNSDEWTVKPVEEGFPLGGPGDIGTPGGHPESWLHTRQLVETKLGGPLEIDGRTVYLVEGLVPMINKAPGSHPMILSDTARIYIDTDSFEVVRVEVDRNTRDSEREDVGYQVIRGIVEIETLEIYTYSEHNAEIEISTPVAESPV